MFTGWTFSQPTIWSCDHVGRDKVSCIFADQCLQVCTFEGSKLPHPAAVSGARSEQASNGKSNNLRARHRGTKAATRSKTGDKAVAGPLCGSSAETCAQPSARSRNTGRAAEGIRGHSLHLCTAPLAGCFSRTESQSNGYLKPRIPQMGYAVHPALWVVTEPPGLRAQGLPSVRSVVIPRLWRTPA
jgi:hypothetical protein